MIMRIEDNYKLLRHYSVLKYRLGKMHPNIVTPKGKLAIEDEDQLIFISIVGPDYDENVPNAMMTARLGYSNAFEKIGIPYLTIDLDQIVTILDRYPNCICMLFGSDYIYLNNQMIKALAKRNHFVWVDPWFSGSDEFFKKHNLNSTIWTWSRTHRQKVLDSGPNFVFTATVTSGLNYFQEWKNNGLNVLSLPLACDTTVYGKTIAEADNKEYPKYAFVGGYWKSKGREIDKYLRPFEKDLHIYGYNEWPYTGYRGLISREDEARLYQNSLVCPAINEPTVKLLKGQINERVFKVLGCGGCCVVDAVPAYRELFKEMELIVPNNLEEFKAAMYELANNSDYRNKYVYNGYAAVRSRHTYIHRVKKILNNMQIQFDNERINMELPL